MDMRILRSFVALAERLNFTEAAKSLFISQSTLSHQITELERELGAPVFYRDKRTVSLTPGGAVFLPAAKDMLDRYERALERVRLEENGRSLVLRAGYYGSPFYDFIPGAVRAFRARRPDAALSLESLGSRELTEGLATGRLDLIFSTSWLPGQGMIGGTESLVIGTDAFVAALPKAHPLAGGAAVRLADLRDEPFVMLERGVDPMYYTAVISLCRDADFFPIIANTVRELRETFLYVEAGLGVTLTMGLPAAAYAGRVSVLPLLDGPDTATETLVVWKSENKNPALALFLEVCAERRG